MACCTGDNSGTDYFDMMTENGATYVDGGMGAREIALTEVDSMHRHSPLLIVSIGTGEQHSKKKKPRRNTGDLGAIEQVDSPKKRKRFIGRWRQMRDITKDLLKNLPGIADQADGTADSLGTQYHRFNVPILMVKMDEWQPRTGGDSTIEKMRTATRAYLSSGHVGRKLELLAETLVQVRRERARTETWEKFALDVQYKCNQGGCERHLPKRNRSELREHLDQHHKMRMNEDDLESLLNKCRNKKPPVPPELIRRQSSLPLSF